MRGLGSKKLGKPGLLHRRRDRQKATGSTSRAYTFELASLHLQLLIAMAAVDEQLRSVEVDEVDRFLEFLALPAKDIERLNVIVQRGLAAPPSLETLLGGLANIAKKPALANALVADLARVAGADDRADEREIVMLGHVCTALNVETVEIRVPEDTTPIGPAVKRHERPANPQPRLLAQHRIRTAVRSALEESYRNDRSN